MSEPNSTHDAAVPLRHPQKKETFHPSAGAVVDERFELIRKIGEGGMGVVYLAKQLNIGRDVVIKLLKPHLCSSEEQVNRFHREASLASRLSHPNCVTIHDFGFYLGTPYIVMEHLEGIPLVEVLYQRGRLSFDEVINLLSQTCDALEAARLLEVVHRDLKPENIFILSEPIGTVTVKVLDFGIAKLAHTHPEASDSNLTRGDMIFGTPQYMSPEQIRGKPIDHRADVYALTVIFYEMVAGYLPYDSEDVSDVVSILTQHLRDPIPLLTHADVEPRVQSMVEQINAVISKGMAKSIKKRISCADDLKQELHRLKELAQVKPEPIIPQDIDHKVSSSRQLVTRPSMLFPTLGAMKHELEGKPSIQVVDLLPMAHDSGQAEPQVSTHSPHHTHPTMGINSSADQSDVRDNPLSHTSSPSLALSSLPSSLEPKLTGTTHIPPRDFQSSSTRKRKKSFFGRLVRLLVWVSILAVVMVILITYPRSPLAKGEWRAHLPQSVAQPLSDAETWLTPKLQPIYTWVDHQLELSPSSTKTQDSSTQLTPQPTVNPTPLKKIKASTPLTTPSKDSPDIEVLIKKTSSSPIDSPKTSTKLDSDASARSAASHSSDSISSEHKSKSPNVPSP